MIRSLSKPLAGAMGVAAAVAGTLSVGATEARAQQISNGIRKPFALKIGGYVPSAVDARRASSDVVFSFEAEYTIQTLFYRNRASYTTIAAGVLGGEDLNIVPITLNQIFAPGGADFFGKPYYFGGGIGVYSVELDSPETSGERKALFGVNAVVGLDLGNNFLAEIKYHYPFDYDRKFVGGFQVMAGVRF